MKTIKLFALIAGLAFLYACGSSSVGDVISGGGNGGNTFVSNGGSASGGYGGYGGEINAEIYGDFRVNNGGTVDTSFTVPPVMEEAEIGTLTAGIILDYGASKLTISSSTTATLDPTTPCATYTAVPVYLKTNDTSVYYCVGTTETVATGLEVQAGAILTLPSNFTLTMEAYGGGSSSARISLTDAVTINGTVRTLATAGGGCPTLHG